MLNENKQNQQLNKYSEKETYLQHPWLDPEKNSILNSQDYFNEISYFIDLSLVYDIVDTCFVNPNLSFAPILIKLSDLNIIDQYGGCQYLIQVWNVEKKNKVYELPIEQRVSKWSINSDILVFTLQQDKQTEVIHIINLKKQNNEILIEKQKADFKIVSMIFNDDILFLASDFEIKMIQFINPFQNPKTLINLKQADLKSRILPSLKFRNLCFISYHYEQKGRIRLVQEVQDGFIELVYLNYKEFADDEKFEYKIENKLKNSKITSDQKSDPIIELKYINRQQGIISFAKRKSGLYDLYRNDELIEDGINSQIGAVEMDFGNYYFKLQGNEAIYQLRFDLAVNNFKLDQAIQMPKNTNINKMQQNQLNNIVKLYTGFACSGFDHPMMMLSHGKFIQSYSFIENVWEKPSVFEHEILIFFRHYVTSNDCKKCILLNNKQIYINVRNDVQIDTIKNEILPIKGEILKIINDFEKFQILVMIVQENNKCALNVLYHGKIFEIDVEGLNEKSQLVLVQNCNDSQEQVLVIRLFEKIKLYTYICDEDKFTIKELREILNVQKFNQDILYACSFDIQKNLFLFDEYYLRAIDMSNEDSEIVQTQLGCTAIKCVSKNKCYGLCLKSDKNKLKGLVMIDLESTINKKKLFTYVIGPYEGAVTDQIELGNSIIRYSYISSLSHIIVCPILHQNEHQVFINRRKQYIQSSDGKFTYILQDQNLITFCYFTGKYISRQKIDKKILDFSKLEGCYYFKIKDKFMMATKESISLDNDKVMIFPQVETSNNSIQQDKNKKNLKRCYYLELISQNEVKIHLQFIDEYEPSQAFKFSGDHKQAIKTTKNQGTNIILYKVEKDNQIDDDTFVKLVKVKEINLNYQLYVQRLMNQIFSPNLQRYIDFDQENMQFVISAFAEEHYPSEIPKDILKVDEQNPNQQKALRAIIWIDDRYLKIVNIEGVESIFDVCDKFKVVRYNVIPLFKEILGNVGTYSPFYDSWQNQKDSSLVKLQKLYLKYKSEYYLNLGDSKKNDLLKQVIFRTEGSNITQSFTFYNLCLLQQLQEGKITIDNLSSSQIDELLYTILPNGITLSHVLSHKNNELEKLYKNYYDEKRKVNHIPLLPDFNDKTAFHILADKQNYQTINFVFQYLDKQDIDHHSRAICNLYHRFIEYDLPNFLNVYLPSTIKKTQQLNEINQGPLKEDYPEILAMNIFQDQKIVKNEIFDKKETKFQKRIQLSVIDLPLIYHFMHPNFKDLFSSLSSTTELNYFSQKSIQTIIDFNFPLVRKYLIMFNSIPFLVFHIAFVSYTNAIFENRDNSYQYELSNWVFAIFLLILSTYFIGIEIRQISIADIGYIKSIWNYIDFLAPCGVITFMILMFLDKYDYDINQDFLRCIIALTTLFMWLKIIQILRIFKSTGYLVRAIIEVIKDMTLFLLILFFTVIMFGDIFLRLSMGNDPSDQFIPHFGYGIVFAYSMILGAFDTTQFGNVALPMVFIVFFMVTILDMIVLFNLLIAIISDTYSRVALDKEASEIAAYQEMAILIHENQFLVPTFAQRNYAPMDQFLVSVQDIQKQEDSQKDSQKMDTIIKQNQELKTLIQHLIKQNLFNLEKLLSRDEIISKESSNIEKQENQQPSQNNQVKQDFIFHQHQLTKNTVKYLESPGFTCDSNYNCCQDYNQKKEFSQELDTKIYYCSTCQAVFCEKCYSQYENRNHRHYLQQKIYKDISTLPKFEGKGWQCEMKKWKDCSYGKDKQFDNENDALYECKSCYLTICVKCFTDLKPIQ